MNGRDGQRGDMNTPVISIIIPVFNAERYLRECVDSVCAQTLEEIGIILVDDGSTDRSGEICDSFAEKDPRVRVIHTENRGCYLARQTGIEKAREAGSAYIGFVDSDDWTDPAMFSEMLDAARRTGADIVECGYHSDYRDRSHQWLPEEGVYGADQALFRLFKGLAHDFLWNKLWKISCFDHFAFPPARAYADSAIVYRLYAASDAVACIGKPLYHYRQGMGSIVHRNDMQLVGLWHNNLGKYEYIRNELRERISPEQYRIIEDDQLQKCVYAIGKNWTWWKGNSREQQKEQQGELQAMSRFVRERVPFTGRKGWDRHLRLAALLARHPDRISLGIAWLLNQVDRRFRKHSMY